MVGSNSSFELQVVFDNSIKEDSEFKGGFGFSVFIYNLLSNKYLLFDAGADGDTLMENFKIAGLDVADLDKVIISHNHPEQIIGLDKIYEMNPSIEIYVPKENYIPYNRKFEKAEVIGVEEPIEIDKRIYSTGQMGTYIKEQSVILHTAYDEVILLTGCAHPGLDDIIDYAHKYSINLKAIVGGFHGFRKFWALEHIDCIYPCHCTQYKEDFLNRFPEHSKALFVGDVLQF
jgi:7,8-dihydropterin-6-yl-methyl-4-(beta-D-ribofuranosyl)aminobenzene 5'-phosphate synthase